VNERELNKRSCENNKIQEKTWKSCRKDIQYNIKWGKKQTNMTKQGELEECPKPTR
jgi:hypothetical protein